MKYLVLIGIFLVLNSCEKSRTEERTTKNHEWLRNRSRDVIKASEYRLEFSDTKNKDLKVLEQIKNYQEVTSELLEELENNTRKDILKRMNQHLDTLIPSNVLISSPYQEFLTLDEKSTLDEFRTAIAIMEIQTFDVYISQMGTYDMVFDSRDIYFVPDFIKSDDDNLTGKLMLAATNSELERFAKMYLNNQEIEISNGYGIVNIPMNELSPEGKFTVKLVGKHNDLEITKELEIQAATKKH